MDNDNYTHFRHLRRLDQSMGDIVAQIEAVLGREYSVQVVTPAARRDHPA